MPSAMRFICLATSLLVSSAASSAIRLEYIVTGESAVGDRPAQGGTTHFTAEIDGRSFRITPQYGAVELSDDDGATTFFGVMHTTPQTPLARPAADAEAPIQGSLDEETIANGDARPGPELFGRRTRVYAVDHRYVIVSRIAYVFVNRTAYHARYTLTVADLGVSNAAVRVALSRGYAYALSLHPEAFEGLPLQIDGTIESGSSFAHNVTRFNVRATSLQSD